MMTFTKLKEQETFNKLPFNKLQKFWFFSVQTFLEKKIFNPN